MNEEHLKQWLERKLRAAFNLNNNIGSDIGYDTSIVEFDANAPDPGPHADEFDYTSVQSLIADFPDFDGVITSFPANEISMEFIQITHPLPDGARILPEPSSASLILLGALALLRRRKKRTG